MTRYFLKRFSQLLLLTLIVLSCKGPETTVVRQSPTPVAADTTQDEIQEPEQQSADFRQINIGENSPITTLDPLFAPNTSTMRAIQLVYEGLVRYDENGNVMSGLAANWEVSNDSLTYRFTLRDNIYYHDSDAFSNGVGRRVTSNDVKHAFERMASINVPDHAASLFMNIQGFQPYYQEQHNVFIPSQRVLDGVSGVAAPNDTTVVFRLVSKDQTFLQKLASPYAVVYPREAITNNNPAQFKAVGAGPFSLSQQRGDSLYIFSKFDEYYNSNQPGVNRVDVRVIENESEIFRDFAGESLHLIPELALQTMDGVLDLEGNLNSNYSSSYNLFEPEGRIHYRLHQNLDADRSQQKAGSVAALFDSTDTFEGFPPNFFRFNSYGTETDSVGFTGDTINISNTNDPIERQFMVMLRNKLQQRGGTLQVYNIFTPTRETGWYMSHHLPFYLSHEPEAEPSVLVEFSIPHRALSQNDLEGVQFNQWPWWIDMRNATTTSPVNP